VLAEGAVRGPGRRKLSPFATAQDDFQAPLPYLTDAGDLRAAAAREAVAQAAANRDKLFSAWATASARSQIRWGPGASWC